MKPLTIVLTGGPCAGKSTALKRLEAYFESLGIPVICLHESATEILQSNINPSNCGVKAFQQYIFQLQLVKEQIAYEAARRIKPTPVILMDRGFLDNKAYLDDQSYKELVDLLGIDEKEYLKNYDYVFYLQSAANLDEALYSMDNNEERLENVDEARKVDERTKEIWSIHPGFTFIESTPDYEDKIGLLLEQVKQKTGN